MGGLTWIQESHQFSSGRLITFALDLDSWHDEDIDLVGHEIIAVVVASYY